MLTKTKKHLLFLYVFSTGIILSITIAILFSASVQQEKQYNRNYFQNLVTSFIYIIQNNNVISHSLLTQYEIDSQLLIRIVDNGNPFSYKGAWNPKTNRYLLFERLEQANTKIGVQSLISDTIMPGSIHMIYGDYNDVYYGTITKIPYDDNRYRSVYLLYYINSDKRHAAARTLIYVAVEIVGLFLLFIIGKNMVGKLLEPVLNSMKSQKDFIAAVSHELKSPLAVIQASSYSTLNDSGCMEDYQQIIQSECKRMSRLIEDMLFLASSESNHWTLNKSLVEVDTLLIETYDLFYPICKQYKHTLELDLSNELLPQIIGDKERLLQVLSILIDNAVSYSPQNTIITIRAYSKRQVLYIEVTDQGIGIIPEERTRIFDRFYRSERSRTNKNHFGLGLNIASEIMRLHNYSISIKDTNEPGTTFVLSFSLP